MRKWIIALIVVIVIVIGWVCLRDDGMPLGEEYKGEVNMSEDLVLSVVDVSVKPTEMMITIDNMSETDFSYGRDYTIQRMKRDKWYEVEPIGELVVSPRPVLLPMGITNLHTYRWETYYGELPAGHYRVVKTITDGTEEFVLAGEFDIK